MTKLHSNEMTEYSILMELLESIKLRHLMYDNDGYNWAHAEGRFCLEFHSGLPVQPPKSWLARCYVSKGGMLMKRNPEWTLYARYPTILTRLDASHFTTWVDFADPDFFDKVKCCVLHGQVALSL